MTTHTMMEQPDPRRATRFPVAYETLFELPDGSERKLHISNLSAHGMMVAEEVALAKGDRVSLRLPVAGRIEAYLVWTHNGRSGFEFERVIRLPDFMAMLDKIK